MNRAFIENKKDCSGCGACIAACPKKSLSLEKDKLGFSYPKFCDLDACINCGLCRKVCPQINKRHELTFTSPKVYYGQHLSENILEESASGGFFSSLATYVITTLHGVVWGVMMASNGQTEFTCVNDINDLSKIRGSKYVEIKKPLDFALIKKQITDGIFVMVSGLPCQILGLYNFLHKKSYPNLLLVDLLCYGIQSPKMWYEYLKEINPKCKPIARISMRNKYKSWFNYSMKIEFSDNSHYLSSRWNDPWLLSYSKALYIRESCTDCQSKKFPKCSDLTIGDYWGIRKKKVDSINQRNGVSLAFVNSEKGLSIWNSISKYMTTCEMQDIDIPTEIANQVKSHCFNKNREQFLRDVPIKGFSKSVYSVVDYGVKLRYKKWKSKNIIPIKIKIIHLIKQWLPK